MNIGPWQLIIVLLLVVLLFGRGRIPGLMKDVAEGIKGFKQGMKDEDVAKVEEKFDEPIDVTPEKDKAANS